MVPLRRPVWQERQYRARALALAQLIDHHEIIARFHSSAAFKPRLVRGRLASHMVGVAWRKVHCKAIVILNGVLNDVLSDGQHAAAGVERTGHTLCFRARAHRRMPRSPCPHRSSSTSGVNQRKSKSPSARGTTKASRCACSRPQFSA